MMIPTGIISSQSHEGCKAKREVEIQGENQQTSIDSVERCKWLLKLHSSHRAKEAVWYKLIAQF